MPPGRLQGSPGASGESWGSALPLLMSWLSCAPDPTVVSAPEGSSPGPGLPCLLMPTPPPPAARLPRGSSAQRARRAGSGLRPLGPFRARTVPPDPLTPTRATRAFSLSRRRRALVMRSWKPLAGFPLSKRSLSPVDALSPGALVRGALCGMASSPHLSCSPVRPSSPP